MTEARALTVCVVIPCLDEARGIATLVERVDGVLAKLDVDHTVAVVDDGSRDDTWQVLSELHARRPERVRATRLSRNFGKDAAILAGLASASADCYIVMDGDGQHPPDVIPELLERWVRGDCDIVSGVKIDAPRGDLGRIASRTFNALFKALSSIDMTRASDYKLLSRRAAQAVLACGDYNFFFRGATEWVGFGHARLPFTVATRLCGEGKWRLTRLLRYATNGIVLYSYVPLYVLLVMGVTGCVLSTLLAGKLLLDYLQGENPAGYTTALAVSLLSLSMMLTAMGILGLYMQHVLEQVKGRPRYVVMEALGGPRRGFVAPLDPAARPE